MDQQTNKLIPIRERDVLLHVKSGNRYLVEDTEAFFSEADIYMKEKPSNVPMVGYRALYGNQSKWFRPRDMFTEDRFKPIGCLTLTGVFIKYDKEDSEQ